MQAIGFTDRFRRLEREYLIQTAVNEAHKQIISSLFHSGRLINSKTYPLPQGVENGAVLEKVSQIHQRCLAEINTLLELVEEMKALDKPDIIEKLGKALCARELNDEGCELLSLAVRKYPDIPGLRFVLGKIYLARGQFDEARVQLVRAVELAPDYPDYRNLLGMAYLKSRKPVAAIDEFRRAVEINIYYDEAYLNLGLGYILNGIVKEDFNLARNLLTNCEEAFQKAALFNPAFVSEDYEKGMALLREEKLEPAYEILSRVGSDNASHQGGERLLEMYLGFVHSREGLTEDGMKQYIDEITELLKTNPGHADLHNELGMAYTLMSKFLNNKAMEHFKEALRLNPGFQKAARNLKLAENDLKGFEVLLDVIVR
jgi:tetratricopeptide (TPR) repeat protein